jgi:molybdenum cofactor cytidylyltransferase
MVCRKPTAGIVLAAGLSSRFGRPKQLLELGGKPLLQWTLDACLDSKIDCIYLVLGYKSQEIMETLSKKIRHPHLKVIVNRNYRKGQSTSLQAGVAEVSDAFPSAMFILGDQPLIDVASINLLLEKYWASEKNICVPLFQKKRGNPTIFSRKFYDEIISIKGDIGARRIIEENPDQVLGIEVKRSSFFHDINTQKDLEKAQSLIKSLS